MNAGQEEATAAPGPDQEATSATRKILIPFSIKYLLEAGHIQEIDAHRTVTLQDAQGVDRVAEDILLVRRVVSAAERQGTSRGTAQRAEEEATGDRLLLTEEETASTREEMRGDIPTREALETTTGEGDHSAAAEITQGTPRDDGEKAGKGKCNFNGN